MDFYHFLELIFVKQWSTRPSAAGPKPLRLQDSLWQKKFPKGPVRSFFRTTDFKNMRILLLNFPFGPEVHMNTGHNVCTTRTDQDIKVETVF